MKVARFHQFLLEKYSTEEIKKLVSLGLMTNAEAGAERRRAGREEYLEDGESIDAEKIKQILSTDGAKKLMAKGLHHVSSKAQLKQGNLAFSLDPNYHSAEGWGIGFFSGPRIVRRLTPKQVPNLVWMRDKGSMDVLMRKFSNQTTDLEFFDTAMAWAADHINFDIPKDELENPRAWKYYVNKRSRRDIGPEQK